MTPAVLWRRRRALRQRPPRPREPLEKCPRCGLVKYVYTPCVTCRVFDSRGA